MFNRRTLIVSTAVATAALAACGGDPSAVLTLSAASSTGDPIEVTYTIGSDATTEIVDSPWEFSVDVSGRFDIDLVVNNSQDDGTVTCSIDGGIGPSPSVARGELGAECSASGTVSDGSTSISQQSRGIPREEVANTSGVVTELVFVDMDGVPTEPTQFEPFRLEVVTTGLTPEIAQDSDITVRAIVDYTGGGQSVDLNDAELYEPDDIVDGRLVHRINVGNLGKAAEAGAHSITIGGGVYVRDTDAEFPIDIELDFDVIAVPITIESQDFINGAITIDTPNSWTTTLDGATFDETSEDDLGVIALFDVAELQQLAFVDAPGQGDLQIFRSTRPLALGDLEDALAGIEDVLPLEDRVIVDAEVGGWPSTRVTGTIGDTALAMDFVSVEQEVFLVQARIETVETPLLADFEAMRDSLQFQPDRFPRLTHTTGISSWLDVDGERIDLAFFSVPADFVQDGSGFTSPDDSITVSSVLVTSQNLESTVAELTDQVEYTSTDGSRVVDGLELRQLVAENGEQSRIDLIGERNGAVLVYTVIANGADTALVDAIVDSLRIVEADIPEVSDAEETR